MGTAITAKKGTPSTSTFSGKGTPVSQEEFRETLKGTSEDIENEFKAYIDKALQNQEKNINEKIKELNRDKISFITVSGTFVAIFTFISVEVQILRYICDFYKIVGFTFVFAGVLLLFISLLDYVARSWINEDKPMNSNRIYSVVIISSLLSFLGLWAIGCSDQKWKCDDSTGDTTNSTNVFNNPTIDYSNKTKIPVIP